jgi:phosphoglycerate dehydrogenase-like enzyme
MNVLISTIWPVAFWQTPPSQVERLRRQFPDVRFTHVLTDSEALEGIKDADVALASRLSTEMIARAPRLRWVHSTAAAVAGLLPLGEFAARGITVTNSRGIQAVPIAEHVLGGLLILTRQFNLMLQAQRERRWIQNELTGDAWPKSLFGRKMTVLGFGTIGQEVARRAHAFGMRVTGIRRRTDQPVPAFVEAIVGPDRLTDVLAGADVLVVAAPSLPETDRLIGAQHLELLNHGAVVVNVARGRIIDEAALIAGLKSGRLGGAVLDVFDREPLDPASPLWTLPNVVISPHSAGVRQDHWEEVIDLFMDNLRRFREGRPLLNMVNCDAGY